MVEIKSHDWDLAQGNPACAVCCDGTPYINWDLVILQMAGWAYLSLDIQLDFGTLQFTTGQGIKQKVHIRITWCTYISMLTVRIPIKDRVLFGNT